MTYIFVSFIIVPVNELRKLEKTVTRAAPAGAALLFIGVFMNTYMKKKPFLDYPAQIHKLKSKQLSIKNECYAINILSKISYYGLINGYKDCFKDKTSNLYTENATFEDIYNLYLFDDDLRNIFLKYILIIERHIKSSISYHFSSLYGTSIKDYQNPSNYEYGKYKSEIKKLFTKMNNKLLGKQRSPQISHYMNTYNDVPLWVLTTDLTFGEVSTIYRFLKGRCKTLVCNDFNHIGRAELGKMLIILTKFRNICAHGNRLFNTHTQDSILDCLAHKKLRIPKTGSLYDYGKTDLFAVVIILKYLLDKDDFRTFYYALKKIIKKYKPTNLILKLMGFPTNWMSILRIKV